MWPKVPALSSYPLVFDTILSIIKVLSVDLRRRQEFQPRFVNKELKALRGCHWPKVTQRVSVAPELGNLLDGIQLEGRRSEEVSRAF